MPDHLDIAIALLVEARDEKKRLEGYNRTYEKARNAGKGYYEACREAEHQYGKTPHKSVINDNLKMARRLIRAEYM